MDITEEEIQSMKDLAQKSGKEYTDDEAREAAWNLHRYAELVWDVAKEMTLRDKRLRKEPDGFPVDGHRSCKICGNSIDSETGWYDKYGFKCLLCQKAVKDGIIPTFACINDDSYFSMWTLTSDLKVKSQTIRKFVREGKLKARIVLNEAGKEHVSIFLRKENPNLILQNNPIKKSRDRNRKKMDRIWTKEKTKEWLDDLKKKKRSTKI